MKNQDYIQEFKVDTSSLNKSELEVLTKLIEAARLIAEVYKLQLGGKDSPQFYPKGTTRAEIEKAAIRNPQILSAYTVVERDSTGHLVAIPYHIKYHDRLKLVSKKLEEAAQLSDNKEFANALLMQANALLNGDYKKAQISWMKIKPYVIDIVIGPIERIEDQTFFAKRTYQAWVGLMHKRLTEKAEDFKDTIFTARRKMIAPTEKVDYMNKAQIRVDSIVIFAGMISKYHFTATSLPNDVELLERYGSEATVFLQNIKKAFDTSHYPIFNTIFAPNFRQSFTEDDLYRGYLYTVMLHEIARVLIRYRYAKDRLKDYYPIINELTVEAQAIKVCGSLLLKDVLSQKELESILVMFLTRIFDYYFEAKDKPALKFYVLGNAILLNSLISSGGLVVTKDGISWPNYTKMFIAASNTADEIEKILAEGSYKDADHYFKKHSSLILFKQFFPARKTLLK